MNNNRVAHVNKVFLTTVLSFLLGSYLLQFIQEVGITVPTYVRLLYSQLILVLPSIIYMWINKIKFIEFIRFKKINFITVVLLILFGFFIRPFMSLLSAISMIWVKNEIANTAKDLMSEVNFGLALLFIAIIPSVFEEFVYRGVFYNEYRKVNARKAVLLSGLLFGLMHMNLNQFFYAFFMGAIFALVIEATDSILASMIVHFTINGSSLLSMKMVPWLEKQAGNAGDTVLLDSPTLSRGDIVALLPSLIIPAIMALIISLLLYYAIANYNKRIENVKQIFGKEVIEDKSCNLITRPLVVGLGICLLIMSASVFI